jgi:hypothetical protein
VDRDEGAKRAQQCPLLGVKQHQPGVGPIWAVRSRLRWLRAPATTDNRAEWLTQFAGTMLTRCVAEWINSYLAVLRIFANLAHKQQPVATEKHLPPKISDQDLVVCLLTIDRILEFWFEWGPKVRSLSLLAA